jgi:large subunit ribosomal protein L15
MVVRQKKKSRKQQGSRTHGWGAGKKHRGAGHRGGKGRAGYGKRGQQRLTKLLAKGEKGIGRKGIRIIRKPKIKLFSINLRDLDQIIDRWVAEKKATQLKEKYSVDLNKLKYKLLGTGKISKKIDIVADNFSKAAKEKIEKAGGSLKSTKE